MGVHSVDLTFNLNFTIWTDCKSQLQNFILLARSHGCKTWTTVTLHGRSLSIKQLHGRSLSSFITNSADNIEMMFSYARHLCDFCDVCYNLVLILSSSSLVNTQQFFAAYLSRSDPVDLTILIKFMDACRASNCVHRKFMTKFSLTLPSRSTLYAQFIQK
jgi:hypothetical protein